MSAGWGQYNQQQSQQQQSYSNNPYNQQQQAQAGPSYPTAYQSTSTSYDPYSQESCKHRLFFSLSLSC